VPGWHVRRLSNLSAASTDQTKNPFRHTGRSID
jgi:hypothetical protein